MTISNINLCNLNLISKQYFDGYLFLFKSIFKMLFRISNPSDLELENMLLLKENQILKRKLKKPKLGMIDRYFYVSLLEFSRKTIDKAIIIKPETILKWHRKLKTKKWTYNLVRAGRPPVLNEVKKLIIEMRISNKRWGYRRIHGELKKLGIKVSKTSVANVLKDHGFHPPEPKDNYLTWSQFIKSQGKRVWACDFFTVETITMKHLYVFFMIDINTREVTGFRVCRSLKTDWFKNYLRSFFTFRDVCPDVLIADRDSIYGKWMKPFLKDYFGIKMIQTPPQRPVCNAYAERMVKTFKTEVTDNLIIYNAKDLENVLTEYIQHYNSKRPHYSLDFNAPKEDFSKNKEPKQYKFKTKNVLDGLIKEYEVVN